MNQDKKRAAEQIGSVPICATCQSEQVVRKAWVCWNTDAGLWELEQVFDVGYCRQCDVETSLVWVEAEALIPKRVQELNDRFREQGVGHGSVMITQGVQAEGEEFLGQVVKAVQGFSNFTDDNDPWAEHDFGAIEVAGHKVFFKFDYYAPDLTTGGANPANEGMTHRVLTIMLASEY